jgi:3-oxoacyl-[acyl-carrier-protein] synthase-3
MFINSIITGSGSFIPENIKLNEEFLHSSFYTEDQKKIEESSDRIIHKFHKITDIEERRYINENMTCSSIAAIAAQKAIDDSGVDPEQLDYIIVAHNFGDVVKHTIQSDMVPSIASRVKHELGIKNPKCVAYDILFGCPGWIEATILAHAFIKAGMAKKCLIVGAEALSRVIDPHDRDSMIFADGAGATVLEAREEETQRGILGHATLSHTEEEVNYLFLGKSNFPGSDDRIRYIKMKGRKIYEYSLTHVPEAMKVCLDSAGMKIKNLDKVLIHQANHKMDEAIVQRFYELMGEQNLPEHVMPMTINKLGNSSVATIPTLYDLIMHNQLQDHALEPGSEILFASVGAGMNINAIGYRM